MKGIIYKATNTFNGKVYIGQTVAGLPKRRQQHIRDARLDESNLFHTALYNFPGAFTWEVIETFTGEKEFVLHALNVSEEYHILKHNSTNPDCGYNSTFGGYSSDKFTKRVRTAMSARTAEVRPILQYDKNGEFIRRFESMTEAARETGIHRKTILSYCTMDKVVLAPNCRTKYIWRFASGNYDSPKLNLIDLRPQKVRKTIWRYNPDGSKYPMQIIESEKRHKYKKMEHRIIQYSLDGEFIKVWDNTHQAAESGADTEGLIRNCLMGKRKSAKLNYQWVFYTPDYRQNIGRMDRIGKTKKADKSRTDERIEEVAWDGTVIATYKDTTEAAQKSGHSQSYICNVIAGRIRHPKHKFRREK